MRPTPDAFEQLARTRGEQGVVEALISRQNQRWDNARKNVTMLSDPIAETLHVAFPIDVVLWRLGVRFSMPPSSYYGGWLEHLRWGVDSACQGQRMCLAGNVVGAAAVARTQLERWSGNRSASNALVRESGATTADYYTSMWADESPAQAAGVVWEDLSEVLHGRGNMIDTALWDAAHLNEPTQLPAHLGSIGVTQTAIQLSLRQILIGVACAIEDTKAVGVVRFTQALRALPLSLESDVRLRGGAQAIWPLTLAMLNLFGPQLAASGDRYRADVSAMASAGLPRDQSPSMRGLEALAFRRARASATALEAFAREREELGDQFSPESIAHREFAYTMINESAGLMSLWVGGERGAALAVGSCALRAAFWLWLEDDDRCLVLIRTVLEQTARLRAWRLKPIKAARLEARGPQTSGRDWLEAAGWRRLSILNRSLGEFAHADPDAIRWEEARQALAQLQPPEIGLSTPVQTARGSNLNAVGFAFGSEVLAAARETHPPVAAALASFLPFASGDGIPREIENWLERCWAYRALSFDGQTADADT